MDEIDKLTPQQDSALRAMATDPQKRFENKYAMPLHIEQPLNIVLTTNNYDENTVHVGAHARRYVFFLCRTFKNHCTPAYFDRFVSWLQGDYEHPEGGYKCAKH